MSLCESSEEKTTNSDFVSTHTCCTEYLRLQSTVCQQIEESEEFKNFNDFFSYFLWLTVSKICFD